jgi:hypothetical protein
MAQHVRVDAELEAGRLAQLSDHLRKVSRAERCAALGNERKRRFRALALEAAQRPESWCTDGEPRRASGGVLRFATVRNERVGLDPGLTVPVEACF